MVTRGGQIVPMTPTFRKTLLKRMTLLAVLVVVVATASSAVAPRASAAPRGVSDAQMRYLKLIDRQMDHDGVFSVDRAVALGVPHSVAQEFAVGLEVADVPFQAQGDDRDSVLQRVEALDLTPLACVGRNGFEAPTFLLDSCNANLLSGMMNSGAGVVAIAGVLSGWTGASAAACAVLAGFLSVQGGLVGVCNSWGTGVRMFPTVVTGFWGCVAQ